MKAMSVPARAFALLAFFASLLIASTFTEHSPSQAIAQDVSPAGELIELAIDDGVAECSAGVGSDRRGEPGFGWVNKLTPPRYPATLRTITIGFNRNAVPDVVPAGALYRIIIFIDPENDGPSDGQQPDFSFIGRVRGTDEIQTFNLITPVTITSGSFVIGALDETGGSAFPALFDIPGRSNPPGTESFVTTNGGAVWQRHADVFNRPSDCNPSGSTSAGSWLVRATIETNPVDLLSATRIKDPLAVEPWAVAIFGGDAFVTNYVSDNITVIKTSDNTFQNVPVGDGPGGTEDGPAGVAATSPAGQPTTTRVYVSLFGSNTIPSKEFPIDYATVGPGRVQVLSRSQSGGPFTSVTQISVGKGPRFPALVSLTSGQSKLYVPCAGADRVDVIDTATNQKLREITVGREPTSCTASFNGAKVYVTNFRDGTVSVIDTRTDTKIRDISLPSGAIPPLPNLPSPPALTNPWTAELSEANGNLYVTYWGSAADPGLNGGIAEIDTCRDEFVRVIIDDATRGTPAGSAGSSGIPAPTAPLTRDSMTGMTPGAGGGGGGPFGIAACQFAPSPAVIFTNDGLGVIGVIDPRIDQVVSVPPLAISSCPKPREVACTRLSGTARHTAYVACGQPDSSVLVVSAPELRDSIANFPDIERIEVGRKKLTIFGSGFGTGTRIELIGGTEDGLGCATFLKNLKINDDGTRIEQKGNLSDGRKIKNVLNSGSRVLIRIITTNGDVRVVSCCGGS